MASLVAQMVKASAYNVVRSLGGEDPRRRQWQPTPELLPGKSHGQRSLAGYVYGITKSLKRLSDSTSLLPLRHCVTLASYLTSLCLHLSIHKRISSSCFPGCSEGEWAPGEKAPRTVPAVRYEGILNTAERTHHSANNVAEKLRP